MNSIEIKDNCKAGQALTTEQEQDLRHIAGKSIESLRNEDGAELLVFPPDPKGCNDKVGKEQICSIADGKLCTGNVMGFIGIGDTSLIIRSRFSADNQPDYFLHYMLGRVLSLNVLDLRHEAGPMQEALDMLIYLFPVYLVAALRQGLYKEYVRRTYDDMRVRGTIDVARQIRRNTPFMGKIAYNVREQSADNPVTQLVRHTIAFIEAHPFAGNVLRSDEEIRAAVAAIREATPTYSRRRLQEVIRQNLNPVSHPYYTAYADLQRLCLNILRYEGLMYGAARNRVCGVLIDGAWLWEEYLNIVLKPLKLCHARNKQGGNPIHPFINDRYPLFPDFYAKGRLVLDAKYKQLDKRDSTSNALKYERDSKDLHQIICYMHVLHSPYGGFVFPTSATQDSPGAASQLAGLGGMLSYLPMLIPQSDSSMTVPAFREQMEQAERRLVAQIRERIEEA